jgi:hypothetical protein
MPRKPGAVDVVRAVVRRGGGASVVAIPPEAQTKAFMTPTRSGSSSNSEGRPNVWYQERYVGAAGDKRHRRAGVDHIDRFRTFIGVLIGAGATLLIPTCLRAGLWTAALGWVVEVEDVLRRHRLGWSRRSAPSIFGPGGRG